MATATIGGWLLIGVATQGWPNLADEQAYWAAAHRLSVGQALYDPHQTAVTPFAYQYAPVLAQILIPFASLLSPTGFNVAWILLLLATLVWLADGRPLVALALVAFLPIAVELWQRNIHLVLAALIVLGIRRWPIAFAIGAMIKLSPGLGIVYLASRGRWREAGIVVGLGVAIASISLMLAPSQWADFVAYVRERGPADQSALLPVPYALRVAAAVALAALAGRIQIRFGEPLLVVAIVIGLPTLWATGLSTLVALVPLALQPHEARIPVGSSSAPIHIA